MSEARRAKGSGALALRSFPSRNDDERRRERIARLAAAVEAGTYRPDAAAIADAMLRYLERSDQPPPC
ncbi:MAG TPA: flagellar biosynthesis anti-sigma factor FlgM [Candidatus Binatia bacterium]